MFWPKMVTINCFKCSCYKDTSVFAVIIIDITLLIFPCAWVGGCLLLGRVPYTNTHKGI
jgi:hypothetical protein